MGSIGKRLRQERERLGLSQTQLAELAGTTRKSQFNYETDVRRPDADYLSAIASEGADVRFVITGQREGPPPLVLSAEEQTMLNYFRDASKEVRRAALGALLGASAPAASHVGGTHSQHSSGTGAIHIGGVGNAPPKRRG